MAHDVQSFLEAWAWPLSLPWIQEAVSLQAAWPVPLGDVDGCQGAPAPTHPGTDLASLPRRPDSQRSGSDDSEGLLSQKQ